jgi:hypothetical protein
MRRTICRKLKRAYLGILCWESSFVVRFFLLSVHSPPMEIGVEITPAVSVSVGGSKIYAQTLAALLVSAILISSAAAAYSRR